MNIKKIESGEPLTAKDCEGMSDRLRDAIAQGDSEMTNDENRLALAQMDALIAKATAMLEGGK